MKKKVISAIVSVMMMISSSVFVQADDPVTITYDLYEDFNSLSNGAASPKFNFAPKTNSVAVTSYPSTCDKSLKYDITTTSDSHVDGKLYVGDGKVVVEFDVLFESAQDATFALYTKNAASLESEILHFDNNLNLCLSSGEIVSKCVPGKFYNISLVISIDDGLMDVYINHKKKFAGAYLNPRVKDGMSLLRFHCLGVAEGAHPVIYLDNVAVYKSDYPVFKLIEMGTLIKEKTVTDSSGIASATEVKNYMTDAVAFYVGKSRMYSKGKIRETDAAPVITDSRAHVPVKAVADAFDANLKWDEKNQKATLVYGDTTVELIIGQKLIYINGKEKEIDTAPFIMNSRTYLPIRAIAEAIGKKATYDKSGMIVLAERDNFFDYVDDLGVFRKLASDLVFETPKASDMINVGSHPRMYATSERIEELKTLISTNSIAAQWYEDIIQSADIYMTRECLEYQIPDGIRLLSVSQEARNRISILASAYQLSGDEKYAQRALKEIMAICEFKDWNPYHFLDTAEMLQGVAFGYDWIYDTLTDDEKQKIETAILEKGLKQALEDYEDVKTRNRTYKWAQSNVGDNWNVVCNSGTIQAAIAVADVYPDVCEKIFGYGMELIKKAALLYAPDGAWYEGPGYWGYTTIYYVDLMSVLQSAYNSTFGYMDIPGVYETGYYTTALTGSKSVFNFHDIDEGTVTSNSLFYLASYKDDSAMTQLRLKEMEENSVLGSIRDLIWYNPEHVETDSVLPLDFYFRDTEVATFRDNWNNENLIFAGIHAGNTNVYHGHMDSGSFVMDAYGSRFVSDLGKENYNLAGGQWDKYRHRAEGHNTLVINPGLDGGQNVGGVSKIDRYETNSSSGIAVIDMTSMYSGSSKSVKRGLKFTNNRKAFILQDEIVNKNPYDVCWFLHSKYPIDVAPDGNSAVIKGDNRNMKLTILENDDAKFSVMAAEPLPTSPALAGQSSNLIYSKLAIMMEDVTESTISVGIEFLAPLQETTGFAPDVIPIDDWTLDEEVELAEMPKLSSVSVNGQPIEEFDPETLSYTYTLEFDEEVPEVTAEGDGVIEITDTGEAPGHVIINISSKEDKNLSETYVVTLKRMLATVVPEGYEKYEVASIEASSIPQPENSPENTIDSDLNTRWSAQGNASITYDLGEVKNINYVGLAIYQDTMLDGRQQIFDILVSTDGINYEKIYSDMSSGETLEQEIFTIPAQKARYVRINCKGTTVGTWNSITECSVYGK